MRLEDFYNHRTLIEMEKTGLVKVRIDPRSYEIHVDPFQRVPAEGDLKQILRELRHHVREALEQRA